MEGKAGFNVEAFAIYPDDARQRIVVKYGDGSTADIPATREVQEGILAVDAEDRPPVDGLWLQGLELCVIGIHQGFGLLSCVLEDSPLGRGVRRRLTKQWPEWIRAMATAAIGRAEAARGRAS